MAGADLAGPTTSLVFERTQAEIPRCAAIKQIFSDEIVQAAATLALRHMNKLMEEQLAVSPAVGSNNDGVPHSHASRRVGDDLGVAGGRRELLVFRQQDAVNHQDPDSGRFGDTYVARVGNLFKVKANAMLKDVSFLAFRPFTGKRGEAFKFLLINHNGGGSLD